MDIPFDGRILAEARSALVRADADLHFHLKGMVRGIRARYQELSSNSLTFVDDGFNRVGTGRGPPGYPRRTRDRGIDRVVHAGGAVNGSKSKGVSCGGIEIEGYLDSAGNFNTAFPKM